MKKKSKSVRQSITTIRTPLRPQDVRKMFRVASEHKPVIVSGMALQFLARLRDSELFTLDWSCWDGIFLRIPGTKFSLERLAAADPILKSWLDVTAPGAPGMSSGPIMAISRDEYHRSLREVMELAKVPHYPGKFPLRAAGVSMVIAAHFNVHRKKLLGHTPASSITARYYNGPSHQSWSDVASGITPEALLGKSAAKGGLAAKAHSITVRALAMKFAQYKLGTSFSCDDPEGYLKITQDHRRAVARVLCDLVSFAGNLSIKKMSAQRARAFLDYADVSRRMKGGKPLSRPTILKIAATAKAVFGYGIEQGLCKGNPFQEGGNP